MNSLSAVPSEAVCAGLMREALAARKMSYCPYSSFAVGAALLTAGGKIYRGCNVENAAYSPGICAERTAFVKAVSCGERDFSAIAIAGGQKGVVPEEPCAPCGVCRQVMMEFCDPEHFAVILGRTPEEIQVYRLAELLPLGFGPGNLRTGQEE